MPSGGSSIAIRSWERPKRPTSRMIRDYLEKWEIPYQYPVAGNGIVALLSGERAEDAGSTVALRADIDALPLTEDPGRPYCSLNPGVMHAAAMTPTSPSPWGWLRS